MIARLLELPLWSAAVAVIGTFDGATVGLSNRWRRWRWRARWTQAHPRGDGGRMQTKLLVHIVGATTGVYQFNELLTDSGVYACWYLIILNSLVLNHKVSVKRGLLQVQFAGSTYYLTSTRSKRPPQLKKQLL